MLRYRAPCAKLVDRQRELEALSGAESCPTRLHRPLLQCVVVRGGSSQHDGSNTTAASSTPQTTSEVLQVVCGAPPQGKAHTATATAATTTRLLADQVVRVRHASSAPLPRGVCDLLLRGFDAAVVICGEDAAGGTDADGPVAQLGGRPFAAVGRLLAEAAAHLREQSDSADLELVVSGWVLRCDDTIVDALSVSGDASTTAQTSSSSVGVGSAMRARVTRIRLDGGGSGGGGGAGDDGCGDGRAACDVARLFESATDALEADARAAAAMAPSFRPFGSPSAAAAAAAADGAASRPELRAAFGRLEARWGASAAGGGRCATLLIADITPTTEAALSGGHGAATVAAAAGGRALLRARGGAQMDVSALAGLVSALAHQQRNETGSLITVPLRDSALLQCIGPVIAGPVCCFWSLRLSSSGEGDACARSSELVRIAAKARQVTTAVVSSAFAQQQQGEQAAPAVLPLSEYWSARSEMTIARAPSPGPKHSPVAAAVRTPSRSPSPATRARAARSEERTATAEKPPAFSGERTAPASAVGHKAASVAPPMAALVAHALCGHGSNGGVGDGTVVIVASSGGSKVAAQSSSPQRVRRRAPRGASEDGAACLGGVRTYAGLLLSSSSHATRRHCGTPDRWQCAGRDRPGGETLAGGYAEAFAATLAERRRREQQQEQEEEQKEEEEQQQQEQGEGQHQEQEQPLNFIDDADPSVDALEVKLADLRRAAAAAGIVPLPAQG